MIRADAGGDRELQVRRLGDPLGRQVGGPERLGDDDVGVGQLALEVRVRPVLVGGDDQRVARLLEESAQAELAGHAAEQLARREVDRSGVGVVWPPGVALDLGNAVTRVRRRIAVDRIVVSTQSTFATSSSPPSLTPDLERGGF